MKDSIQPAPLHSALSMKPSWLKVKLRTHEPWLQEMKRHVKSQRLSTVCEEAQCPNLSECWAGGTVTLMLMGDTCTRGCRFCHIKTGNPHGWLDTEEPEKVAQMVAQGAWDYVVLTVVNRDDLPDAGASHIVKVLEAIRLAAPHTRIETLLPDFNGKVEQFQLIQNTSPHPPEVIAHNMETVERLTPLVRDRRATYTQSLQLLEWFSSHRQQHEGVPQLIKTSLMVGLGETEEELNQTLHALRHAGADILTLGQYLQPTPKHLEVQEYKHPDWFDAWTIRAKETFGFQGVFAGSFVRSSYKAGALYKEILQHTT